MLTFALALALAVGVAAQAQAAPHPFYGISSQTALERGDYQRMGKADVGTLRSMLSWATVDPTKAQGDYNWGDFDSIVAESARNGITVLPFVFGSPDWVAKGLDRRSCGSIHRLPGIKPAAIPGVAEGGHSLGHVRKRDRGIPKHVARRQIFVQWFSARDEHSSCQLPVVSRQLLVQADVTDN